MDKHLALVWKKIDGQLNAKESLLFDNLMNSDNEFSALYRSQVKLSKALDNTPELMAPPALLENILAEVAKPKVSYLNKYNSFNGIHIIAIASVSLLSLIAILGITNSINFYSNNAYPNLTKWLDQFTKLNLFSGFEAYSRYLLLSVPVLFLIWMDNMYRNRLQHLSVRTK